MRNGTETYYRQKANDVLNYIQNHLSDEINIKFLSERFGISFFHFHRILKAYLNEPLGSYIDRMRLDTAVKLIRYSDSPISEIASRIGFSDSSALSKAFSKRFGISPQRFRNNKTIVLNTHVDYNINYHGEIVSDIEPKIVVQPDKQVIYAHYEGEYGGKEFRDLWDVFWAFIVENNAMDWKADVFTMYYDDPFNTPASQCRSDFCVATNRSIDGTERFGSKTIAGGKYALFRYKGPHERLMELYEYIFSTWALNSNYIIRDAPSMERYLNNYRIIESGNLLTEIYIPIL